MGRDAISPKNQINLWGKQTDSNVGLEPQRSDLFFIDFTTVVQGLNASDNVLKKIAPASVLPQMVRSFTPPEIKLKAEPYRRDNIPYNMPSWDEPLDAVKITFLLNTTDVKNENSVLDMLDIWHAASRAGRGSRSTGFNSAVGQVLLNADYSYDFTFNVPIHLLRGAVPVALEAFRNEDDAQLMSALNAAAKAKRDKANLAQLGKYVPDVLNQQAAANVRATAAAEAAAQLSSWLTQLGTMTIDATWILRNAWLAGYRISDLSHDDSKLVTVEAAFYAESFERYESRLVADSRTIAEQFSAPDVFTPL